VSYPRGGQIVVGRTPRFRAGPPRAVRSAMPPERDPQAPDDDLDLDAVLDDFADRSGPDPAREPGVDPAGGDDPAGEPREDAEGEPPPP
jgi:hypothetical protein